MALSLSGLIPPPEYQEEPGRVFQLFLRSWYQDKRTSAWLDPKLGVKAKLAEMESGRQRQCLDNVASVVSIPSFERIEFPFVVEICRVQPC